MRCMRHLSVALIAVGLSVPALGNNILSVPSQHGGFKIAVDPLYLRNNPGANVDDSNFDFGIFAQIGYLFPATGNDLTANYTYLRSGDTAEMKLDVADLEIGQRLTTDELDIRLFSGIRYAHLNSALDFSTSDVAQSFTGLFHGIGPRFGADARYQLGNDSYFGIDTHIDAAFLIGNFAGKYENSVIDISESTSRVVPEVNAKLGIDYTYPIPGNSKSLFAVEVGYQTNNYVHALNSNFIAGSGDANFDGVYLDVKYYS